MLSRVWLVLGLVAVLGIPDVVSAQGRRGRKGGGEEGGPAAGTKAPDFELNLLGKDGKAEGKKKVRLSKVAKKSPVALVFGSYT